MLAQSPNGYRTGQIASTFGHGSISIKIKDGVTVEAGKVVSVDPATKELIPYDGTNPFGIVALDHYENTTLSDCLPQKQATVLLYGVITATKVAGDQFGLGDTFDIDTDGSIKAGTGDYGHIIDGDGVETVLLTWKGF